MATDNFSRMCLAAIVVLLAIVICNQSTPLVRAAPLAEYMIEGVSGQVTNVVNAHMKKRVADGWTLHAFGASYLVWQKQLTQPDTSGVPVNFEKLAQADFRD